MNFINRNLLVLFVCQIIFVSATVLLVTVGGLVGTELAPVSSLATLPVAIMVVGTAIATIPAAITMRKVGRQVGFMLATVIAASGAWTVTQALETKSFLLFCVATGLMGAALGFTQHFRFAAAESVDATKVSYAISFILLGSIAGAILSPELIKWSSSIVEPGTTGSSPYRLAFYWVIAGYALAFIALLMFHADVAVQHSDVESLDQRLDQLDNRKSPLLEAPRSLLQLAAQPLFYTAVLAGVVGQGVMTYVMTATPISMNINQGYDVLTTSEVIRAHVIAMYLPSLVTPWLIDKFGLVRVMATGVALFVVTLAVALSGHHVMHYWLSMISLGVGWNFLFVGGTTMLVSAYREAEKYTAQAINDFSVFGMSALASLLAGSILFYFGWQVLLLSVVPMLMIMVWALITLGRQSSRAVEN